MTTDDQRYREALKDAIPLDRLPAPRADAVQRAARYFRYYLWMIALTAVLSALAIGGGVVFAITYTNDNARQVCYSRQFARVFVQVGEAFKTPPDSPSRENSSQGIVDTAEYIRRHPC